MPKWSSLTEEGKKFAIARHEAGESWEKIANSYKVTDHIGIETFGRMAREYAKQLRERDVPTRHKTILSILKQGKKTLQEICDNLDLSPKKALELMAEMQAEGHVIQESDDQYEVPYKPRGDDISTLFSGEERAKLVWASISDTHFGSRFVQKTALLAFLEEAYNRWGVRHVLHSGDIHAGFGVYAGQAHELYATTAEEQSDDAAEFLLQRPDLRYYCIGGNHDYSLYRSSGTDIIRLLSNKRPDIVHLGWDEADVPLTDSIDIRLWHPSGGLPYSLSYRGQKYVAEVSAEELTKITLGEKVVPTVRFVHIGHLHVFNAFTQGPIYLSQAMCFEGTNGYLAAKGHRPHVGGIVWEAEVDEEGHIIVVTPHWYMYPEIEQDYKRHMVSVVKPQVKLDALYSLSFSGSGANV